MSRATKVFGILVVVILLPASFLLVYASLLTPPVRAPRNASNASAVKAISTIQTAQVQYYSNYNRFATSMQELGPPASGAEGPSDAGLIDGDLARGQKAGYTFVLSATATGYAISAQPIRYSAGLKSYFSDQNGQIHVHNGSQPATADDPTLGETH